MTMVTAERVPVGHAGSAEVFARSHPAMSAARSHLADTFARFPRLVTLEATPAVEVTPQLRRLRYTSDYLPSGRTTVGSMRLAGEPDRRVHRRQVLHVRADSRRLDHSVEARRVPQVSLMIQDVSLGGVGGSSQTPLNVGERLAIYFPPRGHQRGWDARGRVVRCEKSALGWRFGVQFDAAPIAA